MCVIDIELNGKSLQDFLGEMMPDSTIFTYLQIYYMQKQLSRSVEGGPHFQKDVIIPSIYNLENIKLIQSCSYPESPPNKVAQLKKRNIQNIIRTIINKPHVQSPPQTLPRTRTHTTRTLLNGKTYKEIYSTHEEDGLVMELEEELGDLISNMEENLAPATDRIQATLAKVAKHLSVRHDQRKQLEVQKYLAACPRPSIKTTPEPQHQVKGMLDELEDLRKSGVKSPLKRRVQSARVLGRQQTEQFAQRQAKSRLIIGGSTGNLKVSEGLSEQIQKSRQLITMINDCLGDEEKKRRGFEKKIGQMKSEWSEQGKLQRTLLRSTNMPITSETLSILREKRLKQQGLARIDRQTFQ